MVLDGNSIINRAYYGVRPLTTRDGFFTHAIFGFLTMLGRLLDEEKPEALCVAFDRREPTFRHLEYEGLQGHTPRHARRARHADAGAQGRARRDEHPPATSSRALKPTI